MREVISLHVGQCGNQVGDVLWQRLCIDHGLSVEGCPLDDLTSDAQRSGLDVFFCQKRSGVFEPRALLIDSEPSAVDSLLSGPLRDLFGSSADAVCVGQHSAGNCWASGYSLHDRQGLSLIDKTRLQVERCDSFQGFQMLHSAGGGTGSGFGSWLLETLRDDYPDSILNTFTIASGGPSNVVVEPYNNILCLSTLISEADAAFLVDNAALGKLARDQLGARISDASNRSFDPLSLPPLALDDFNGVLCDAIVGISSAVRLVGENNIGGLRKLIGNITPFPDLHMFTLSAAEYPRSLTPSHPASKGGPVGVAAEAASHLLDTTNMMLTIDPERKSKLLAASLLVKQLSPSTAAAAPPSTLTPASTPSTATSSSSSLGPVTSSPFLKTSQAKRVKPEPKGSFAEQLERAVGEYGRRAPYCFADWSPHNIMVTAFPLQQAAGSLVRLSDNTSSSAAVTCIANATGITSSLRASVSAAQELIQQMAYLHRFEEHNIDRGVIEGGIGDIVDLCESYEGFENETDPTGCKHAPSMVTSRSLRYGSSVPEWDARSVPY